MMRAKLSVLVFIFFFSTILVWAQQYEEEEVPPGMQIIKVGPTRMVVPKDFKMHREGGLIVWENTNEYVARKIQGMQDELDELSRELEEIKGEVKQFRKVLDAIKESMSTEEEAGASE